MGTNQPPEPYDVVIVGAGICGLNALFVAAQRLGKRGRIALVERRPRVGGMWNDTYDYVRLHQPHPFFTAGDVQWQWDKDPAHLATKPEVLGHLQHCLDVARRKAQVDLFLGASYVSHKESGGRVRTTLERDGGPLVLESAKLVKALGLDVSTNDPLPVSSTRVRSVSPDSCDVRTGEIAASDAPVWVIGGGKTAMDTVHALVTARPGREVGLLAGSGTYFIRREAMYGAGPGYRRGLRPNKWAEQLIAGYDGTTDAGLHEAGLGSISLRVTPTAQNWLLGFLSEAEADRIREGLTHTLTDHLVDVVDAEAGPEIVTRSGQRIPVPPGTWVVNCTGYLWKVERPYEPYCSPSGRVLSINARSDTGIFPAYNGYFLTHLLMRDKLATTPLWAFDAAVCHRDSHEAALVGLTVLLHNFTVMLDVLPPTVFLRHGADGDRWYPFLRRLAGELSFMARRKRLRAHYVRVLENVRSRYDLTSGPLDRAPAARHLAGSDLA